MKNIFFITKLCLTTIILYFVLKNISFDDYKKSLILLDTKTLLSIIAIVFTQVVILAYRWKYLVHLSTKTTLPLMRYVIGILISFFFSQGLPASIGGDAFKIWWMKKDGTSTKIGLEISFYDRIYGLIALTIACVLSIFLYFLYVGKTHNQISSLAVIISITSVLLWLCISPYKTGLSNLLTKTSNYLPTPIAKTITWGMQIRDTLSKQKPTHSIKLIATSLINHMLVVFQAYLAGKALCPEKITLLICLLSIPPALFISYMPFSIAGWGVREASMVMAFGMFSIDPSTAIIVSLTIGAAVLITSLVGGLLWLTGWKTKHQMAISNTIEDS